MGASNPKKPKKTTFKTRGAKNKKQKDVRAGIDKTNNAITAQREALLAKKKRLEALEKSGTAKDSPEYMELDQEVTTITSGISDLEKELEDLTKEGEDVDMAEVQDDEGGSNPPPLDDDEDITFTLAQAREAKGELTDGVIVAWKKQGRSTPVIVRYGPMNAGKYERSTAAKEDNDFDEKLTDEYGPKKRLGDVKEEDPVTNIDRFIRQRREFIGIIALAYNCHVNDLKPREKGAKGRPPPLEIFVKWQIGGKVKKCWEVRSSIQHLFSSPKKCHDYIHLAAVNFDKRHQEWLNGERKEKERSPTAFTTDPPVKPEPGETDIIAKEKFQAQWCETMGIDPKDMSEDDLEDFDKAWKRKEANLKG